MNFVWKKSNEKKFRTHFEKGENESLSDVWGEKENDRLDDKLCILGEWNIINLYRFQQGVNYYENREYITGNTCKRTRMFP